VQSVALDLIVERPQTEEQHATCKDNMQELHGIMDALIH